MKKALVLPLTLLLGAGLSCDMNPTRPPETGAIRVVLLTPSGAAFTLNDYPASLSTDDLRPIEDRRASVTLTGARLIVTGPTTKTVTTTTASGPNFNLVADGLAPGSYSVVVQGLVNGEVAHIGATTGVTVTAGATTPATVGFPSFQPVIPGATITDTTDVLRFTVSFDPVQSATSYIVAWSLSPSMTGASSKTVTTTSTEIAVTEEGKYYVTVRAVNPLVSSGGLASDPKTVYVFQGVATVTVTAPASAIAAGETVQLTAEARDADDGVVNNVQWFWASSNHSVATVDENGLVTGKGEGQAQITALGKGTPGKLNLTVNVTATQLAFTIQPGNRVAGVALSPAIQVEIRDAVGNRVTSSRAPVTIAIGTNPGAGTLSGSATVNAVDGIATFSGLSIDKAGAGYTLAAGSTDLTGASSSAFDISPAALSKLMFTQQPASFTTADDNVVVQVSATDAFANVIDVAVPVTLSFAANTAGATLGGTTTLVTTSGVANFTDLVVGKVGTGYVLSARSLELTPAESAPFEKTPGAPAQLAFVTPPSDAEPAGPVATIEVAVQDAHGNLSDEETSVAIALTNPPGAILSGTLTATSASGVATFTDLSIDRSAVGYTFAASATDLTSAVSTAFDIALEFVEVDIGTFFACGRTNTGAAYCWGNGADQRGDGTGIGQINIPSRVTGGHQFVALTVGPSHSCGIRAGDGVVLCWGAGSSGQLGSGMVNQSVPTPVTGGTAFASVSAGFSHTCGIRASDGRVLCWGSAGNGRLGNNTTTPNVGEPTLTADPSAYLAVSAGGSHSCAIRASDQRVLCWGFAANGRLGNNTTTPDVLTPGLTTNATAFSSIGAGATHTCGTRSADGLALCWGNGTSGQLGNGDVVDQLSPVFVSGGVRFVSVEGGSSASCGVTSDGDGFCWGNAGNGMLGNGTNTGTFSTPQPVFGDHAFFSIRPGSNGGSCGAAADGGFCWGFNGNGQLGNGTSSPSSIPFRITGSR